MQIRRKTYNNHIVFNCVMSFVSFLFGENIPSATSNKTVSVPFSRLLCKGSMICETALGTFCTPCFGQFVNMS